MRNVVLSSALVLGVACGGQVESGGHGAGGSGGTVTDVLSSLHTHPANRIAELLPHRWKPPDEVAVVA